MRHFTSMTVAVLCVALAMVWAYADEEVGVKGGGVSFNGSKRLPQHVWIQADFGAYNKTDESQGMKFKVTPMKQSNFAVYEYVTKMPPDSKTTFSVPISGGATEKYALDLILDGHRSKGSVAREHLAIVASEHHHVVTILNDDDDLVTGKLSEDIPTFHNRYLTSFLGLSAYPRHWVSYDSLDTVLVQRPDFASMTTRQFKAIKDYVARGGTIVFNNPKGVLDAVGTPLEELLPVMPLQLRQIEVLGALKGLGGRDIRHKDGFAFLDSLPIEPGLTTISHEGFPVVRWRRFGLGYVGFCAVNPSGDVFLKPTSGGLHNYHTIYRHLLSFGDRAVIVNSSRDTSLSSSVDKLTGVKIPGAGTIRAVVVVYLALFFLLILGGAKLRKHVEAWGVLTVLALVMILGTYVAAAFMRSSLPKQNATILSFTTRGENTRVTENFCGLMVKGEVQMDLVNASSDVLLRPMPSPWTNKTLEKARFHRSTNLQTSGRGKKGGPKKEAGEEVLTDPLQVTYAEGRPSLLNMTLRDGKPRFFNTALPSSKVDDLTLPVLEVKDGSFVIEGWKTPVENLQQAALIFEDGFLRLKVSDGEISLTAPYSRKEVSDPVVRHILEYLGRAGRGVPMVALFSDIQGDQSGLISDEFSFMGRQITMIPVRERIGGGPVDLPKERVRVTGSYANPQSTRVDGYWVEGDTKVIQKPLLLGAKLPGGYRRLNVSRMTLTMDAENRGGNVAFDVYLLPQNKVGKKIKLTRNDKGVYEYDFTTGDKVAASAINRADGTIQIGVQVSAKTEVRDPVARLKMNTWKIKNISVSVRGEMPNDQQGSL